MKIKLTLLLCFLNSINSLSGAFLNIRVSYSHEELINVYLSAAREGNLTKILKCIPLILDYNITDRNGKTSLILASEHDQKKVVAELLKLDDININAVDKSEKTALTWASENGNLEIMSLLIAKGARINAPHAFAIPPLIIASEKGKNEAAWLLLKNKANPNILIQDDITPLMIAVQKNNHSFVKLLLSYKANINQWSDYGQTPLTFASKLGYLNLVQLLINRGANINLNYNKTITRAAYNKNNIRKHKTIKNHTPLITACKHGHFEVVRFLIENGAFIDIQGTKGNSALMYASKRGHNDVVKLLIERGADVNLKNDKGESAIVKAAKRNKISTVRLLVSLGADPLGIKDPTLRRQADKVYARDTIFKAVKNSDKSLITEIIKRGHSINIRDSNGFTPLHYAIENKDTDMAMLLLYFNPNLINERVLKPNLSTVEFAISKDAWEILENFTKLATIKSPARRQDLRNNQGNNFDLFNEYNWKYLALGCISTILCYTLLKALKKILVKPKQKVKANNKKTLASKSAIFQT